MDKKNLLPNDGAEEDDVVHEQFSTAAMRLPRFSSKRSSSGVSIGDTRSGRYTKRATKFTKQDLSSAEALMSRGVNAMNETLAAVVQDAIGAPIPTVDVRFRDLRITAQIPLSSSGKVEVPTLWTHVRSGVTGCFKSQRVIDKEILRGISGAFKPGRITLVLGQPGSGKSALMKILSGRFPMAKNIKISGDIKYNDLDREEILNWLPRYVAYADQKDDHYPTMTVLETFQFAHKCCAGKDLPQWMSDLLTNCTAEQHQRALEMLTAHHTLAPEIMIKKLGLERCKNTVVGNAMLRGVSGGERKRVTTGEMSFGIKKVQLLDEISTGLDSAATYDIVSSLKSLATNFNCTVVISLLQPSPEVFGLFDDVLILNEGQIMFHGEREQAVPYFESIGFRCPPRRDIADFLLDLGTDKQHAYKIQGFGSSIPFLASDFANLFSRTDTNAEMMRYLDTPFSTEKALLCNREPFRQNVWDDLMTLLYRQMQLTLRNRAFLVGRAFMVIIMGLLYGSTFWQMDTASAQLVLGLLFSCAMFLSMGQASQVATFMAARTVFYKQRGSNFFRSSSYVLAASVTQIPFAIMETILFGSVVYWMSGYVALTDRFLVFLVTLFFCQMWFTAFFFLLSSATPNLTIAQPLMMIAILFFMLFSGFLMSKNDIPDYFLWFYWIDPLAWCIRALSINQYMAPAFRVCKYGGVDYCTKFGGMTFGEYSLSLFDLPSGKEWIYYGWIYFAAGYVLLVWLAYLALEFKRYESPESTSVVQADLEAGDDLDMYTSMPLTPKINENNNPGTDIAGHQPLYGSDLTVSVNSAPQREILPVTLAFEDLWYSVPLPGGARDEEIDLLKGVTGFALPGSITALMGSSGAGKTTLMDVIAGRKTGGRIRGKILLNGYPSTDLAIRRCTGYCEQMDIHSDSATIREALVFSAFLRQDANIPTHEKLASVEECIELLELGPIADSIIRGSSTEQLKRLTIGVELAAHPSILFMDEPTSGLDARAAKLIMNGVRKIANTGRTVICTIHQPSTEVFNLFDSLLLLQRGGRMVFFGELGENSSKLIDYFHGTASVKRIEPGYNPATWMLECIGAGVGSDVQVNFADVFDVSDQKVLLDEDMDQDGVSRPSPYLAEITFTNKRAAYAVTQLNQLCARFFRMYWRTPTYNLTRLMVSSMLSVIFGIIYQGTDYTTYSGANAGVGMIFVSTVFLGIISFNSVMPVAAAERTAYYRERASQTYNALWYFIAGTVAEIPYVFLSGLLFSIIMYPSVGFTGYLRFFMYWFIVSLNMLLQVYFGQLMVYLLPSVEVASVIGALLMSIFMLFAGFNPPASAIPTAYKWIYYIAPPSYSISILVALLFGDCSSASDLGCQVLSNAPPQLGENLTLKEYVEGTFDMKHDRIVFNTVILGILIVGFRLFALFSLRFVNHLKR